MLLVAGAIRDRGAIAAGRAGDRCGLQVSALIGRLPRPPTPAPSGGNRFGPCRDPTT
jgi:hypothetical protein